MMTRLAHMLKTNVAEDFKARQHTGNKPCPKKMSQYTNASGDSK